MGTGRRQWPLKACTHLRAGNKQDPGTPTLGASSTQGYHGIYVSFRQLCSSGDSSGQIRSVMTCVVDVQSNRQRRERGKGGGREGGKQRREGGRKKGKERQDGKRYSHAQCPGCCMWLPITRAAVLNLWVISLLEVE